MNRNISRCLVLGISLFTTQSFAISLTEYKETSLKLQNAAHQRDCETIVNIAKKTILNQPETGSHIKLLKAQLFLTTGCHNDNWEYTDSDLQFGANILSDVLKNDLSGEAISFLRTLTLPEQISKVEYSPKQIEDFLLKATEEEADAEAVHQAYEMFLFGNYFLQVDKTKYPTFTFKANNELAHKSMHTLAKLNHPVGYEAMGSYYESSKAAQIGQLDITRAFSNFKLAAELGNIPAASRLAKYYGSSLMAGKPNYEKVVELLLQTGVHLVRTDEALENAKKMLNCNEAAKVQLQGQKIACIKRDEFNTFLKEQGVVAKRVDKSFMIDIHESHTFLPHTTEMKALYTKSGELASLTFNIEPSQHEHFNKLATSLTKDTQVAEKNSTAYFYPENENGIRIKLSANEFEIINDLQTEELRWESQVISNLKTSDAVKAKQLSKTKDNTL